MAKFSGKARRPVHPRTPIRTVAQDAYTFEGGRGYSRDPKSDLFLLAISNMVSENTFYEAAEVRDARYADLIHTVAGDDPGFIARMAPWLRNTANMRTASLVMAAEYERAMYLHKHPAGAPSVKDVVDSVLVRADEPAEILAYWRSREDEYGRFPIALRRGVAKAAQRLITERNVIKYDGGESSVTMADVIELTHPKPKDAAQAALFKYLLDRRHEKIVPDGEVLPMLHTDHQLRSLDTTELKELIRSTNALEAAGWTWERLSSFMPMDAEAWEFVIPQMGYMALLRNLRNFDEKGVSDEMKAYVAAKLSDPEEVAKSRQFPIRFFSAWKNVPSMEWGSTLEKAVNLSLQNVPVLKGRTLVLVDRSGSMFVQMSRNSAVITADIAALFGTAIAMRSDDATLIQYGSTHAKVPFAKSGSLLRTIETFTGMGGTNTFQSLQATYDGHDRVVILTDEQAFGAHRGTYEAVDNIKAPIYTFNLVGYGVAHLESGGNHRYTFGGGLTDACFTLLETLEKSNATGFPF